MTTCTCGQSTRDNAYACDTCAGKLQKALAEIPWLADELEVSMTKQQGVDYSAKGGGTGGTKTQPLPLNAAALEAGGQLRAALITWTRFCHEEQIRHQSPRTGLPILESVPMSRWLLWRIDGLTLDPEGPAAIGAITTAVQKARRVIDKAPEKRYAGPCSLCKADLYHRPGATEVTCKPCDATYDVGELYDWMKAQVIGRLVTAKEGAMLLCRFGLETKQDTIKHWHARKRLPDHGTDASKRRLYLFDDLLDLATKAA